MSILYVTLINVILLFIVYVVLNHKINKNSTSALLDKYAREVENLIVELNRTLDDVLNLSEERVNELKRLIKKTEKLLGSDRPVPGAAASGGTLSERKGRAAADAGVTVDRRVPADTGASPGAHVSPEGGVSGTAGDGSSRRGRDVEGARKTEAKPAPKNPPDMNAGIGTGVAWAGEKAPGEGSGGAFEGRVETVSPVSVPLYDMRGKKVDIRPAAEEDRPRSARPANILERSRHLLSMGHSKDEIARMLNLSRAEMEFLASLHNK